MQEKPFESITVQDVLERANVSRSTFYSHFSDKDDLLLSDADEFFEALAATLSAHGDKSDRVFPVREFFAHVREAKSFVDALMASGKIHDNFELAQEHFARGIQRRIIEIPRGANIPREHLPALCFAHAGALMSLLRWWIDRGMKETPDEMDALFHSMVWKA
jgi:AcrR family transcriptional regulator